MANQRLFIIQNVQEGNVGSSMSTRYSFNNGTLSIFWKGRTVLTQSAKVGDAYLVECKGDIPKIMPLSLPHGNEEKVMWLCGFNKYCRALSREEYKEVLAKNRAARNWWNYREYTRSGDGWVVTLCNRPDFGGVHHVVAYIEKGASKAILKEFLEGYLQLRWFYFPKAFIQKVLEDMGIELDYKEDDF